MEFTRIFKIILSFSAIASLLNYPILYYEVKETNNGAKPLSTYPTKIHGNRHKGK
jgi:hypothetical protein